MDEHVKLRVISLGVGPIIDEHVVMTDIVERLRAENDHEAADEIEKLRKLLYDITIAWDCGLPGGDPISDAEVAKLLNEYDAHSVPGPWHVVAGLD